MPRTTRKTTATTLLTLLALFALASLGLNYRSLASLAAAAQGPFSNTENFIFTNASLKGTYAGVLDCSLLAGPVTGRCIISYLYTADGNGNTTNTDATINLNGTGFTDVNFPGTYTVQTNGRVVINATPTNGPFVGVPLTFSNVVTETSSGQITEMRGVGTSPPGVMATTIEKRIRR